MIVLSMVILPFIGALVAYMIGKSNIHVRNFSVVVFTSAEFVLSVLAMFFCRGNTITIPYTDYTFIFDGFRGLYCLVITFMWFMTALFSPQYFESYRHRNRYYFFFLATLGATAGTFLSGDLVTAFTFFEIMSLTSFVWVIHEETDGAKRAANTYLAVALIGGLVALMGLFILKHELGTLVISRLYDAAAAREDRMPIYIAAACLLFGFGAKAGMFPLHIWLPKAHPVAPAPASALLSGALTKVGVFGILIISCDILRHDATWGRVILVLGVITMFLGAFIAIFSINIKHILACSSMSQIGFILVGIAMQCLLGEENRLAAAGTMLHMLNHSLVKLILFMAAGAFYINFHTLDLNRLRGCGRGRVGMNAIFLGGALSLAGVPLFCGYVSKTLLHESIVEYAAIGGGAITFVEWLFLLSGGLTIAYLTKIYVTIFVERPIDGESAVLHDDKLFLSTPSTFALSASAVLPLCIGALPHLVADRIAALGVPFMASEMPQEEVHYFSFENLKGFLISACIGALVYLLVIRGLLGERGADKRLRLIDRRPAWLDLEDLVYRPLLLKILPGALGAICAFFAALPDKIFAFLSAPRSCITSVVHALADLPDAIVFSIRHTLFRAKEREQEDVAPTLAYKMGAHIDRKRAARGLPDRGYAERYARTRATIKKTTAAILGNFSFALLMSCIGIGIILLYLIFVMK